MTSPEDGSPSKPLPSVAPANFSKSPTRRILPDEQSMASSTSSLPLRKSNASSSVFAATSTPPTSRPMTPTATPVPPPQMMGSVFLSAPNESTSGADSQSDPRYLLSQAYAPHIAVHTSSDVHELARDKGFSHGLWEILRSFGDRVQGKITIRDSVGASRTYEDFAIHFVQLGDGTATSATHTPAENGVGESDIERTGGNVKHVEAVVEQHLNYAEGHVRPKTSLPSDPTATSPFFTLYLRRLLAGLPLAAHETFSHPVACVMAISSRNPQPLDALRRLYDDTSRGDKQLPLWVHAEYLRYYVLVHDEERDDIGKSMALFEQMKRHFGLHCHLLRLRSSQCVPTDDDSVELPRTEWISAAEELAIIQATEGDDLSNSSLCVFESDATAVRTFIREMVTQSVIPSMERCVSTWNDQVASRRRGLSGRFISMSKKWNVFGGRGSTPTTTASSNSSSNYDPIQGFYRPETPEATMRKLADYAFMLRDWKLAQSVYDLLRSDFSNDKAWRYHAAVNEMAAISTLLTPPTATNKVRTETIDQLLETAAYSYFTRCGSFYGTLRCLAFAIELLRLRGGSSTDAAARWGCKLLEFNVVGPVGTSLLKERVAACYASRKGAGSGLWGARTRKSAMWNVLAADSWLNLGKYAQAECRLKEAESLYERLPGDTALHGFAAAQDYVAALERELRAALARADGLDLLDIPQDETLVEEVSETLDTSHRRSVVVGTTAPPLTGLETAPLNSHSIAEEAAAEVAKPFE